ASPPPSLVASTPVANLPVNASWQQTVPTPTAVPLEVVDAADAEYRVLTNVYERVAPSVVNIEVTLETPHPNIGDVSTGSGFVYDADGNIITNAHVVQGATEVRVTFNDGYVAEASVVGVDTY